MVQVFDFARWQAHRSTTRYVRHTIGKPLWRMIRQLALPLAYVLAVSLAVSAYQAAREVSGGGGLCCSCWLCVGYVLAMCWLCVVGHCQLRDT